MQILNIQKLETLLVANWTGFLNTREILAFVNNQARYLNIDGPISSLTISRFEFIKDGFLLWMEYSTTLNNEKIRITTEALLTASNELLHIRSEYT